MKDIKVQLQAIVQLDLVKKSSESKAKLEECCIDLLTPEGLVGYRDEEDKLTKEGIKALTNVLVQGLNANIQGSHQGKKWDSAEHLRYVISELERSFVAVTNVIE